MKRTFRIRYTFPGGHGLVFFDVENEQAARERFAREHPGTTITEIVIVNQLTAFLGVS